MNQLKSLPLELAFWITALALLATADPHLHHFTLCPLANLGLTWCPGCGFGRSITLLFNGEVKESLTQHWFGIPGLGLIIYRVFKLTKQLLNTQFNLNYKED